MECIYHCMHGSSCFSTLSQPVHYCIEPFLHGLDFFLEIFLWIYVFLYMDIVSKRSLPRIEARSVHFHKIRFVICGFWLVLRQHHEKFSYTTNVIGMNRPGGGGLRDNLCL